MGISQLVARTLAAIFLASAAFASQLATAAGDKLLFWRVDTPGATIHLLGSMHMSTADVYPLRPEIMQAWRDADYLVVEVDISGAREAQVQQAILANGMYFDGRTLQDDLSPRTYAAFAARLNSSGLPPEMTRMMKPGLAALMLMAQELEKAGLDPEQGIDKYFLRQAAGNKPILELETVELQMDVILNLSQPDAAIRQTLSQIDNMDAMLERRVSAWKRGDAEDLARQVIDEELAAIPELAEDHRRIYDDRNHAMTAKIAEMQARGGNYFVVVGAAHLVGDQGIVSLLEKRGQSPRRQ